MTRILQARRRKREKEGEGVGNELNISCSLVETNQRIYHEFSCLDADVDDDDVPVSSVPTTSAAVGIRA